MGPRVANLIVCVIDILGLGYPPATSLARVPEPVSFGLIFGRLGPGVPFLIGALVT